MHILSLQISSHCHLSRVRFHNYLAYSDLGKLELIEYGESIEKLYSS